MHFANKYIPKEYLEQSWILAVKLEISELIRILSSSKLQELGEPCEDAEFISLERGRSERIQEYPSRGGGNR